VNNFPNAPQQTPPPQFQQSYAPQTPPPGYPPQQASQPLPPQQIQGKALQEVKFYKSALFLFSTAAGRFQRDCRRMQSQGWQIKEIAFLGVNVFLQRIIVVVYER